MGNKFTTGVDDEGWGTTAPAMAVHAKKFRISRSELQSSCGSSARARLGRNDDDPPAAIARAFQSSRRMVFAFL